MRQQLLLGFVRDNKCVINVSTLNNNHSFISVNDQLTYYYITGRYKVSPQLFSINLLDLSVTPSATSVDQAVPLCII